MSRILLEDVTATFVPDRAALTQALTEAATAGRSPYPLRLPGRFSLYDTVNGNNRIYPKRVWEKNLIEGSPLMVSVKGCDSLGLLEHPKDGKVDLLSPISHIVTRVTMEGGGPAGEITLVGTPEGNKLRALIEAGYTPKVSSRGYGSVVKRADGVDEVQEDFICESWDVVFNPSFKQAVLIPPSQESAKPWNQMTPEERFGAIKADVNSGRIRAENLRLENGVVILENSPAHSTITATIAAPAPWTGTLGSPSLGSGSATISLPEAAPPLQPPVTPITQSIPTLMDTKQLRESVQALRTIDAAKLDPRQISEGFSRMHELHRDAAQLAVKEPNASWDVQRAHDELNEMEKKWQEVLSAPAASVTRLQEQQTRTLKVLREAAAVGLKYRGKLSEALKTVGRKVEIVNELAKRGNAWRVKAQKLESGLKVVTGKLDLAYESLDEFTRRYHEDTTKLARHALMLEYKGKIEADAALLKRVNEATRVENLTTIREELSKPAGAPPATPPITEGKAPVAATVPPVTAPVADKGTAPAATPPAAVRVESNIRTHSVNETVAMTVRLSQASAALNG